VKVPRPCLSCGSKINVLVDFGPQTPSNRFELPESPVTDRHPLVVGQCEACGLIQLVDPMAPAMAKSRFEWLTYNEPEGHLDDLVSRLRRLPGLNSGSRIVGLTYKDDTTLARFNRLGHANTYRYEPAADFGLTDPHASLESIQAALDATTAARLAAQHSLADVLLVRHVLEHAHDPLVFLRAAATLVKPGGHLLFEMPDSEKFIKACDYSFIWEEHITYLCAPTLAALIGNAGLSLHETIVYPYPLEDSLIGLVRNAPGAAPRQQGRAALLADGASFASRYPELRARLQTLLGDWQRAGKKTAIFGAGHLAAKFVNMYGLGKLVDCVIDDNSHKRALLMPGSRLAIRGSADLDARGINLCLLSLSPESEQKVRAKNQPFLDRGGRFLSIFALSPVSVYAVDPR
jgi:SAM-dependent methyltransferase